MAYWDELDRAQPAPAEPNLWPDGDRAPVQITVRPQSRMYDDLVDPNNIGMSEADTGGWGSTWDKLKGGMFAQLLAEPFRKGAGFLGAMQDYSANEFPLQHGVTAQTTDYDPRREAAGYAAGTAMNVVGTPAFTGGVPAGALGSGARRLAQPETGAVNLENRLLYGGTHSPDTPSGNYMVRYTKEGAPELVDLTTEGGRQHHAFSTLRTGLPVDEMSFKIKGAPDIERNVWNIEDLQKRNAALQFGVSDPTVGGGKLVKVGDTKLDNPVAMEGGLNYSLLHADKPVPGLPDAQRLFANQKGPVTGILNEAREWADKGYDPIFTSMMLAKTSGDQAKQTARTAYRVMRQAEPDKDIVALIDKAMAQQSKDIKGAPPRPYPGFASKDMEKWLEDVGGPYRAAFVKALDTSPVLKGTGADMGQVRFANTDKRLRSTPTGASGLFMGGIKPELGAIDKSLNSTYPSAFLAQKGDIGGLQGNVPFHTIAPDLWRGLMKSGDPKIFANVPAYYMARGMPNNLGKVQPVTQEVVDNVSEFFRRNPKGWALAGGIPAGVAASLMASDQAEAAPVNMWGRQ